jgi:rhodanese-related sulfurtransferase
MGGGLTGGSDEDDDEDGDGDDAGGGGGASAQLSSLLNDPTYKKYITMLKVGISKQAVAQKMSLEGLNPDVLDLIQPGGGGGGGGGGAAAADDDGGLPSTYAILSHVCASSHNGT